ncbi:MAG: hypothetical protein E4H13_07285 [Calditrichales bacterium]|nr:MAG: hypothetical protein E4H13_07285 [Calditrichales bacterium]
MENAIRPDMRYRKKCAWIFLTISFFTLLLMAIINLIVYLAEGDLFVTFVFWIVIISANLLMWLIAYPLTLLWVKNLAYFIQDERITIHMGILTKTQQNIPFRAVTDFALSRTIFDRILGIGSIKVQTAGQTQNPSGYEGHLAGLLDYESLHEDLRSRLHALHPMAEAVTTAEKSHGTDQAILAEILHVLKEIKTNTAK